MDACIDKGRVENELFVFYLVKHDVLLQITTNARYFCVLEPANSDADDLVQCLGTALKNMGIDNILEREDVLGVHERPILVGYCSDVVSVNIFAQNGMQGKFKAALPWLNWKWCYAHRLELACKDSFTSNLYIGLFS